MTYVTLTVTGKVRSPTSLPEWARGKRLQWSYILSPFHARAAIQYWTEQGFEVQIADERTDP